MSEEHTASIFRAEEALKLETVSSSETTVGIYQTFQRNIPEDSHLYYRQRHRRENFKSRMISFW
jgi:hypothetical protein